MGKISRNVLDLFALRGTTSNDFLKSIKMRKNTIILILLAAEMLFLSVTIYQQVGDYNIDNRRLKATEPYSFNDGKNCSSFEVKILNLDRDNYSSRELRVLDVPISKNGRVNLSLSKIKYIKSFSDISSSCSIRMLNLSYNGLENIPLRLREVHDLEHLICSDNAITSLGNFSSIKNLRRLDLSSNNITDTYSSFARFRWLEYLDLSDNFNLERLPENIQNLKNLKELNIAQTKLAENESEVKKLKEWLPNTKIYLTD